MAKKNGTAGDDVLIGSKQPDTINGLSGNDFLYGYGGNDTLDGGDGFDILLGDDDNAGTGNLAFGKDKLSGGAGNDLLAGGEGNDTLDGGDGDDILIGGRIGNASFNAQYGYFSFTWYTGSSGFDTFIGGAGNDRAYLTLEDAGTITLDNSDPGKTNTIYENGIAVGSLSGIERLRVYAGGGDDVLTGGVGFDYLNGGNGDDTLKGGGSDDTLNGGSGDDRLDGGDGFDDADYNVYDGGTLTVDLGKQGMAQDTGAGGVDTLVGLEGVTASGTAAMTLTAGDTSAFFSVYGYGDVTVSGGGQADTVYVYQDGDDAATVSVTGGAGADDIQFEQFGAANNAVTLDGGDDNDTITVFGGSETSILGGSGNDVISLNTLVGTDTLTLGTGSDTIYLMGTGGGFRAEAQITVTDFATGSGGDRIDLSSWLAYGALLNTTAGANPFADGHLKLVKAGKATELQVDRDGTGTDYAFQTLIVFKNTVSTSFVAENFAGLSPAPGVVRTGGADADKLEGTGQDDVLTGNGGSDKLTGLGGTDILYGDFNSYDSATAGGNDTLDGGDGDDLLIGGRGNDTLSGGAGNDTLFTGVAYGAVSGSGGYFSYNYTTYRDGGDDVVDGGTGFDRAIVVSIRAGTTLDNSQVDAVNRLTVGGRSGGSLTGVEALTFYGGAGDDDVTAGSSSDALYGGEGHNVLRGGGGDDTLQGGIGADTFDGGLGTYDTVGYSSFLDTLTVTLTAQDKTQNTIGGGRDTLVGIENLLASNTEGADVSLEGDSGNNALTSYNYAFAGNYGAVTLTGNAGDDSLYTYLNGGTAAGVAVTMSGGAGIDRINFAGSSRYLDTVTLGGGADNDAIYAYGAGKATIDAGSGGDYVVLDTLGGSASITLGGDRDTLALAYTYGNFRAANAITITDFATGANGDILSLDSWLSGALTNLGGNPFGDGHLRLVKSGTSTLLQVDRDGGGDSFATLLTFQNTKAAAFTAENFGGYAPDGSASVPLTVTSGPKSAAAPVDWMLVDPVAGQQAITSANGFAHPNADSLTAGPLPKDGLFADAAMDHMPRDGYAHPAWPVHAEACLV